MAKVEKALLHRWYVQEKKSVLDISKIVGLSIAQVSRYLKKYDIKTRPFSTKGLRVSLGMVRSEETRQKIRQARLGKKLSPEHRDKVIRSLSSITGQNGANNPGWKEGKHIGERGYVFIRKPEHPRVLSNGYVAEHRLVMEEKLGRYLTRWEHVHHINGIKGDNRPENLELVNATSHNLITRMESRIKELEKEINTLKNLT